MKMLKWNKVSFFALDRRKLSTYNKTFSEDKNIDMAEGFFFFFWREVFMLIIFGPNTDYIDQGFFLFIS
jgi:hypothetical protein